METDVYLTADRFPLVRDIGTNRVEQVYTHPDRLLDYDVFVFVAEGSMQVVEEGREYVIGAGEHLFLKKGLRHWGLPQTAPGTSWYWIHFNSAADDKRMNYADHPPLPVLDYFFPDHYEYRFPMPKHGTSLFHRTLKERLDLLLADYMNKKPHRMTRVSLQAYLLFMELKQASLPPSASPDTGRSTDTLDGRVIAYLMQHMEEDYDSGKLAAHMNLNYSYLSAAFKKLTGRSILEVHTRLRMNRAIELMRTSSMPVSELSERLGYKNPFYFSRVFKKTTGESPSAYRNQFY
ncbi:helix-turn-helix transcriptional regulator [Paenibacillus sp. WST5]|uniref:Helix-turn-helix transcriptional regulator n=2 Tax=Paenibacillus sedimenti TaxID=2770274 RepID=A0A926QJF2_9BACL|nr:helix-turn-helix transcriptional regulator [Paenibacillus sedimenti]